MTATSNVSLIRAYFNTEARPLTMDELKALTREDREELGALIQAEADAGRWTMPSK